LSSTRAASRVTYLHWTRPGIKITAMTLLNIGPDGLLFAWAVLVSLVVALLSRRRVGVTASSATISAVALGLVAWEVLTLDPASPGHQLLRASLVVVPTALLFGASRLSWLARRSWVLVLVGPFVFVGCFVGICACAYRLFGA